MIVSSADSNSSREYPYAFHYRMDQKGISREEITKLAGSYGVAITDWKETQKDSFVMDGHSQVEEGGGKFHYEYHRQCAEGSFFSQSAYNSITGQNIQVKPGEYYGITTQEETGTYFLSEDATLLTNINTGKKCAAGRV